MKTFLSNTIAKWFKRLGFAGALRWRILYWAYKIWPGLHIRDAEWDFVLNYLPPLNKWQSVFVLDVGATSSLFVYELARRGYKTTALDIRPYQEKIRHHNIRFTMRDITLYQPGLINYFNFITCISVVEHIPREKQLGVIGNMLSFLKPGGRLLLTIPTFEYAQGHDWAGFNFHWIMNAIAGSGIIIESTERKGQICVAIERLDHGVDA